MPRLTDEDVTDERYQMPDGTPKYTGRTLHQCVVYVRVDDDACRSDLTIHVEHPNHSGGVRCFHRTCRETAVPAIQSHLDRLTDGEPKQIDLEDNTELGITTAEIRPECYESGALDDAPTGGVEA